MRHWLRLDEPVDSQNHHLEIARDKCDYVQAHCKQDLAASFAALQQSVEELSQNMQTLLQTAQEMLQNIQAVLETPRTNVTVKDAGNAAGPHANVAASKRRDGGLGSARRSGRGIYAAVDEGGQEMAAEAP